MKQLATVRVEKTASVATIIMNQPEKRNPLTIQMTRDLALAIADIAKDRSIRSAVITGAGSSFSAGADVEKEVEPLHRKTPDELEKYVGEIYAMLRSIMELEKPVVAAINGYAIATGLDLALACDFRIMAEDARLGELRLNMGLTPSISAFLLTRMVGMARTKVIAMLSDTVSARDAENMGLVYKVVPGAMLMTEALALAKKLANGPRAIGVTKKLINYAVQSDLDGCMKYFLGLEYQVTQSEDHREAVKAYLEKRRPVFKGC